MKDLRELAFTEVREILHPHVNIYTVEDLASKVLGDFKKTNRYEAVVTSGKKVGLVTVRDMLDVDQPEKTRLDEVWTITGSLAPSDRVLDAVRMMNQIGVRAIPVIENNDVLGCVSQVEVCDAVCEISELPEIRVMELMRSPVLSLEINEKISTARRLMIEKSFSHVPVAEYNRLVGIVTAESIVHAFIAPIEKTTTGDVVGEKVGRFPGILAGLIDRNPLTLGPDESWRKASCDLRGKQKSACVVTDGNRGILGILTPHELMRPILSFLVEEELPVYVMGLEKEDFFEKNLAEDKIRRVVQRTTRIHPHIEEVRINIKRSKTYGVKTRYEMTARALSAREEYKAEATGWDLLTAFKHLCERLEKEFDRTKHEPEKVRARRTNPGLSER